MAYSGHNGVKYSRHDNEDETGDEYDVEPVVDDTDCVLDELYYESYSGELNVTVETPDGYLSLQIPVKAESDWNKFVDSLPLWEIP